ncbi:MAG: hypothetical protein QME13_05375, partial [Thermoanaerobacteraceae bacterium]|nr:hypothetical protein [Thermoanaerobacteraceae bacterium]
QQIELLKNKAEFLVSDFGQLVYLRDRFGAGAGVPPQENFSKILTQIGPAGKTNQNYRDPTPISWVFYKKRLQEL